MRVRHKATHKPSEPLCFVLMPFAKKHTSRGGPAIDFNEIYHRAIEPGVRAAGMVPIRADEEKLGGIIHKEMFNRLLEKVSEFGYCLEYPGDWEW